MDRRTFLTGTAALLAAALLPRALARPDPGARVSGLSSIDELLEGGSRARRARLARLADDQALTRSLAHVYELPDRVPDQERKKVAWTLRQLAYLTDPDHPETYSRADAYAMPLEDAVAQTAPHLGGFGALARSVALDDRLLAAKIARESNGDPNADNGALGLLQVEPATYAFHVGAAAESVASNRAVLPSWLHREFMDRRRPLRDALLFTPELARRMGLRLERRSIGLASESEYLDRWLPFGLVIERDYGGRFPQKGETRASLLDPETNIAAGGLVALDYLFQMYGVTKRFSLPHAGYDPAQVLADPSYPLTAAVALTAFNAGPAPAETAYIASIKELGSASNDGPFSVSELDRVFDRLAPGSQYYRRRVINSTGKLQWLTDGSIANAR